MKARKQFTAPTQEAEETLDAIRRGQVDALVIQEADSHEVYALRSFAEINRTQLELRKAGKDRKRTNAQLQALLDERERLFQDLHDGCIQSIYAVGLTLEAAMALRKLKPNDAERMFGESIASLNLVIQELRSFMTGQDMQQVTGQDLQSAIEKAVRTAADRGLAIKLDVSSSAARSLTNKQSLQLLQIARECISNATRHSGARTGHISLRKVAGRFYFEVRDDGCGFVVRKSSKTGFGLHHIQVRARRIGGAARVISKVGHGTCVAVEFGKATSEK